MKIIISESQAFTLKSLNGVTEYVENYLSQFDHFVKLDVKCVEDKSVNYYGVTENPILITFEVFIDGPVGASDIGEEIQFAMDMYFPRYGEELISVIWDCKFNYV
jgi:hypothetical protein